MATLVMRRIREGEVPFDGGTAVQEALELLIEIGRLRLDLGWIGQT